MDHIEKRVFPVIHYLDAETALEQAGIAFSTGADGIFLIAHHSEDSELFMPAITLKGRYPGKAIGVNFLRMSSIDALQACVDLGADMVWDDHPGIHSTNVSSCAQLIGKRLNSESNLPLFFGSIAFKGQLHEPDPVQAAHSAIELGMLATTSGEQTGVAPSVQKIRAIYDSLASVYKDKYRLAIASGMTPENVHQYKSYATDFLVATGVSKNSYEFDKELLAEFVRAVKA